MIIEDDDGSTITLRGREARKGLPPKPEYTVLWEIQVYADTPEQAALEAESIMHDYSTDGHRPVFAVFPTDAPDTKEEIDLENMGELLCAECGEPYFVTDDGMSHHEDTDSPDGIDHGADGDHVAHEGIR